MTFDLLRMAGGLKRRVPTVPGVTFDGTNDFLDRGADLTSNADTKTGIVSFWINPTSLSVAQQIYESDSEGINILLDTGGRVQIVAKNSSNTDILILRSDSAAIAVGQWQWFGASWDLADTSHMYVADASGTETETNNVLLFTNDTIDYTRADHFIGVRDDASSLKLDSSLAQFFFTGGETIDLSSSANRDKFRNLLATRTLPVEFGATGTNPTGNQPQILFNNSLATWQTNLGTGGGFTENGALTAAATNPSD